MVAAQVAIADINAKGGAMGKKLKLIWADSQSTFAGSAQAAEQVIGQGAQVMLVDCDADYGLPATQIAQKDGIAAMNLCAGGPSAGNPKVLPLGFSMGVATNVEAAAMAGYAYDNLHYKRVYLLQDTSIQYSKSVCSYFQEAWQHLGGTIAGELTFTNSDTSIQSQVSALLNAKGSYDAIDVCSYAPGLTTAVREIRAAGISAPLLGSVTWDGSYWLGSSGAGQLSNAYYPAYGSLYGDDPSSQVNALVKNVKNKMGSVPFTSFALPGYASVQALADGIEKAGTTNGKELVAAMQTFTNVPMIVGPVTYTPQEHIRMEGKVQLAMMKIVDGKQQFVQEYYPSYIPAP
jgi:branched-chain amino acid transport system substrate-binding protein